MNEPKPMTDGCVMLSQLVGALRDELLKHGDQTVVFRPDGYNAFTVNVKASGGKGITIMPGEHL